MMTVFENRLHRRHVLALMASAAALSTGIGRAVAQAGGEAAPVTGGAIEVAIVGEVPTLDSMVSSVNLVGNVAQHIFETLYTFDESLRVAPLLAADMPTISEDGKTYEIPLREGVKFHDGSEMTADDVVPSLLRWQQFSSRGKTAGLESVEAVDPTHVRIVLKSPLAMFVSMLAMNTNAAIILPAEKQANPMTDADAIGTGPYRLKEHAADQYIQLVRFDDYSQPPGETNGYAGERKMYLDEIRFVPVPDPNTRLQGAIAGQYHFADQLPIENLPQLTGQANTEPLLREPFGWVVFVLNKTAGIANNTTIARAVRTALNEEDMLAAAFGDPQYWKLDGAMFPEPLIWHTDAGVEGNYNVGDPEAAKALLAEAGYDGSPLRILTSHQYEFHYKMAQVAAEYLRAAGFTVDLQVYDWATMSDRRNNSELWDIYITHSSFLPDPGLISLLSTSAASGWKTEARAKAMDAFMTETDTNKRVELWGEVQKVIADEVPFIKIGDFNALYAKSVKLQGITAVDWPFFWNAWLAP
jgi:peptide/nickel transport system substrate-binding protein